MRASPRTVAVCLALLGSVMVSGVTCTPLRGFKHDHAPFHERTIEVNGKEHPYFQQMFWAGLITGPLLPSTVFPTGLSRDGLPIGVQAVGNAYNDYITIDFARLMAREFGGFQPPPDLS
jgi:amidase